MFTIYGILAGVMLWLVFSVVDIYVLDHWERKWSRESNLLLSFYILGAAGALSGIGALLAQGLLVRMGQVFSSRTWFVASFLFQPMRS